MYPELPKIELFAAMRARDGRAGETKQRQRQTTAFLTFCDARPERFPSRRQLGRSEMTTRRAEKVRKLRALARDKGAFENEAAVALAKAQALETKTVKAIAYAVARLLETRGLVARVRRRNREKDDQWPRSKVDAEVRYYCSRSRYSHHQFEIQITEYE
jgi:Protein of unknown function (DUF2786)